MNDLILKVQTSSKDNITPNRRLSFFHLSKEIRITNDTSCISNFSTDFVKSRNETHDGTLWYVSEGRYLGEWLFE